MTDFPTLADVIAKHRWSGRLGYEWATRCTGCDWLGDIRNTGKTCISLHADHVQDEWRKACTIQTVEQLRALPVRTVVQTVFTNIREKLLVGWLPIGGARPLPPDRLHRMLPALVLYVPGDPA